MNVPLVAAAGVGLAVWAGCLRLPRWTHTAGNALHRRWRAVAATLLGMATVLMVDPLGREAPGMMLRHLFLSPGLALRVLFLALIVIPVVADAVLQPFGARTLLTRAGRFLRRAVAWGALPLLSAALAAHSRADIWSRVLGGGLWPPLAMAAGVLLGASAPFGTPSTADPAFPWAVDLAAAAAALVLAAQWLFVHRVVVRTWRLRHAVDLTRLLNTPAAACIGLAGIFLLALHLRWGFLVLSLRVTSNLSLDAQGYFEEALRLDYLAQQRHVNYFALFFGGSTYSREPGFIFLLRGWLAFLGTQTLHVQYLSVAGSLVWVLLSAAAVWALLGRWPALLAGLLLAIDDIWIRNSAVGLREEVTGALLVAEVALLFSRRARKWRVASLAPICAALASLTRLDSLPFALFVLVWGVVGLRWPRRHAVMMGLLLLAVLAPTFAGYALSRGSPFPAATSISTNNWKDEFQDRLGTPGYEEDRQVTAFEFLFRYHTPAQVAVYTLRGARVIYAEQIFDSLYYLLARWSTAVGGWGRPFGLEWRPLVPLVFTAGCGVLLVVGRRRRTTHWLPVALCAVGVLPPIGFSAGVPGHMMYQARYGYLVAPFAMVILAWTVCVTIRLLSRQARAVPWPWRVISPEPRAEYARAL